MIPASGRRPLEESALLGAVDAARREAGLLALQRHPLLDAAAVAHLTDLLERHYFDHVSFAGEGPQHRLNAVGYRWGRSGENLSRGPHDAEGVVAGWLASPGHRANVLEPTFEHTGVAVGLTPEPAAPAEVLLWVQVYAHPLR